MKNTLMLQLGTTSGILQQNLAGFSHQESLVAPQKGGNNANWVLGHMITANSNMLQALGAGAFGDSEPMAPYRRGSGPLDPAKARPFGELLADFNESHALLLAKLGDATEEQFAAKSPFSPRNDPNETIGSLAALVAFHQAYHAGQTGLLRRVVGRDGAVA